MNNNGVAPPSSTFLGSIEDMEEKLKVKEYNVLPPRIRILKILGMENWIFSFFFLLVKIFWDEVAPFQKRCYMPLYLGEDVIEINELQENVGQFMICLY